MCGEINYCNILCAFFSSRFGSRSLRLVTEMNSFFPSHRRARNGISCWVSRASIFDVFGRSVTASLALNAMADLV